MATNYTLAQAIKIMHEGTDTEAIIEITRRFPQLALLANTILTKAGEDFVKLTSAFPEWMTANKMNGLLKKTYEGTSDEGDESTSEEVNEKATEENAETEEKPRRRRGKAKDEETKADEAKEEETESDDPYAGKSAMDLFKECKKRKIKVEPKKPAKFYADLLKKDDASKAKADEADDDDWGDEEEAEEKKPAKKAEKKPAKKDDDDEDWDI